MRAAMSATDPNNSLSSGSSENAGSEASGPGYVHLRVHSALSLLEGALPIKKLLDLAKADDQPALAIADTNNRLARTN